MLPKHLYQQAICKSPKSGAYYFKHVGFADDDAIIDYATTLDSAYNLVLDYQVARDTGQQKPMAHSMVYYCHLMANSMNQWKNAMANRQREFDAQCNQEAHRQLYEQIRSRHELIEDLWRIRNRRDFMDGFYLDTHPENRGIER